MDIKGNSKQRPGFSDSIRKINYAANKVGSTSSEKAELAAGKSDLIEPQVEASVHRDI